MHEINSDGQARSDLHRWKCLGVLSVAALLLHAAALSGIEWAWPARELTPLPAAATPIRAVDVAPPLIGQPEAPALPAGPPVPPAPVAAAAAKAALTHVKLAPAAASAVRSASVPATEAAPPPLQLALSTPAPEATSASAATAGDEVIPHYRTQLPPAMTLHYEMQRGGLRGTGDLSWRPQGDRYELKLDARISGLPVLTQTSAGGFDAAGVAPLRFTDQRLRRAVTAANFQRGAGKITFSGPATEFELRDGAQDRLSWMVQLAGIVAGEPQLRAVGAKVLMYVVGSHGDAGVWVFRCLGPEAVSTGAGIIAAIKFMREPREAYDTTVQVWLDPQQHDLPVRATQKSGPNDEVFELRLQEVVFPN